MGRVLHFDPHCEASVARGTPHHTPRRAAAAVAADLATVSLFLAGADDTVWLDREPRIAWLDELVAAGFTLPRLATGRAVPAGEPAPWGWSPDAARRFGCRWDPALGELYRKTRWTAVLAALLEEVDAPGLCSAADVGVACLAVDAVLARAAAIRRGGASVVGVKAPLGTSGRGVMRLDGPLVTDTQRGWIARIIALQGAVLVEPWRRRLHDLSVLLEVGTGPAEVLGVTRFATDERGQYLGAWLDAPAADHAVSRWLPALHVTGRRVGAALAAAGHRGPAGIDALVFAGADGRPRLKPLLEVNPRTTMGHVALALRARVEPTSHAVWRLFGGPDLTRLGLRSFAALAERLRAAFQLSLGSDGRLASGAIFTNDPHRAKACLGALMVAAHDEQAPTIAGLVAPFES